MIVIFGKGGKKAREIKLDEDKLSPLMQALAESAIGDGLLGLSKSGNLVFKVDLGDILKYISMMVK